MNSQKRIRGNRTQLAPTPTSPALRDEEPASRVHVEKPGSEERVSDRSVAPSALREGARGGTGRFLPRCIRYHATCLDGIVSAALAARAFGIRTYLPYTHATAGTIPDFVDGAIGVDIPLIPGMVAWFDHHATGPRFFTPEMVASYGKPMCVDIHYDPTAPACAVLLPSPPSFAGLLQELGRLDGAKYATAGEATDIENPIVRTSATVMRKRDHGFEQRIITALADTENDPVSTLMACIPDDEDAVTRRAWATDRDLIARHGHLDRGVVTFDATAHPDATIISSFLAEALFPNAQYAVLCMHQRERTAVELSVNPWTTAPVGVLHALDRIATKYDGGGHRTIASIKYPATAEGVARARATLAAVAAELRTTNPPPTPTRSTT